MYFLSNLLATPEAAPTLGSTPLVTFGYLVQVFFSLLIVFGLIYLTARYVLPKFQLQAKGKLIQISDRVGLEPQVSAYVLKVGHFSYLVVVSSRGIAIERLEETL